MIARDKRERILGLARKELLEVFRDPNLLRIVVIAPVIQLVVFGYAVSTDVHRVSTFVVDQDHSADSRNLTQTFFASGYFRFVGASERPCDLVEAMNRGRALVGLQIPRGFEKEGARDEAAVQVVLDGTNSNTATVAMEYAQRIIQNWAIEHANAPTPPVELRERAWFNPALRSRDYNVPAVIGNVLMILSLMLTSLAVVRERELGTLEQLMVSPLTPGELIVGKTVPFALLCLVDAVVITAVALVWFHVPFRGNVLILVLASVLYLVSTLGLGLLISTFSSTQQEAVLTSFLLIMPLMLLSGFMFPVTSMPAVFQWLTLANPVRHFLEIDRAVFLKGAGFMALWRQFLALALIGVSVLMLAARRFHKTTA